MLDRLSQIQDLARPACAGAAPRSATKIRATTMMTTITGFLAGGG